MAFWELDEGTGSTAADSSGNGYDATYVGSYTHSSTVAPIGSDDLFSYGNASGTSSTSVNVSVPSTALTTTSGSYVTVELWMHWNGTVNEVVFDFASTRTAYSLLLNSSAIGFTDGVGDVWGTSIAGLANGWHLIDAEYENGSLNLCKLYIDGVRKTLSFSSGSNYTVAIKPVNGSVAAKVGGWFASTTYRFSGQLDEVSIFNAGLSDTQVSNHWYAESVPGNTSPPSITGAVEDAQTMTAQPGSWAPTPTSYAYQWQRCDSTGANCADISGANSSTLKLADSDVGATFLVKVTATNANGSSSPVSSRATPPAFPLNSPHIAALDQAVSTVSPYGYWKFNSLSGTSVADASGNGRPLTVSTGGWSTGPIWDQAGTASDSASLQLRGNQSSQTPGDRAYLSSGTSSTFLNNFSVQAWVKWTHSIDLQEVFGFGNLSGGWQVMVDNYCNGCLDLYVNGAPAAGSNVHQGPAMPVNQWVQVGLTRDNGTWKLYLGPNLVWQGTQGVPTAPSTFDFFFGSDNAQGGGFAFTGDIASGAFYPQPLSDSAMAAAAKSILPPAASPQQSLGGVGNGNLGINPGGAQAEPVDTATGNFYTDATDLQAAGAGVPFVFSRSYNSGNTTVGRLGQGWTDSLAWTASTQSDGSVVVTSGSGQQLHFTALAGGGFAADGGGRATLAAVSGGGYQLVTNDQIHYVFDSNGRLTSETDRNGEGLTLAYDSGGNLSSVTDSAGRSITITTSSGKITQVALPNNGGTVRFAYNGNLLQTVTDALNGTTTYSYDTAGRLTTITDPTNTVVLTNVYDSSTGRVTSQTDARGKQTTFSWNPTRQTESVTDPNGKTWTDLYNGGVLVKQFDGTGDTTYYTRDSNLGLTSVTSPSGDKTTMTYDANGNVLTATAPASLNNSQKTFTYDSQNNVASVKDALGNTTTYTYDANGNLAEVDLNGTKIAGYTYNNAGQKLTATDGNGKTTRYTYDAAGNLASVTDPLGNETTYTYDADGHTLTKVDPLGNVPGNNPADYTTTYTYDAAGNLLSETDPLGHRTAYTYDANGHVLTTTDPNGNTTTNTYDGNGDLLTVTGPDPDGPGPLTAPITTYTYDNEGNKLTETDPNNHTTTYAYDASNRLISKTDADGNKTTYTYDANGNLASVTDPRGNVAGANPADYTAAYTYDAAGRRLTATDSLGHVTSYVYDAVGNRTSITDANNHTTSYTYDAQGRILTVTAPDGGVTTYTYDGNGNVLTRTDANNHTTTNLYNDRGELVQVTGPDPDGTGPQTAPVTTYSYDANGNKVSMTDPNGNATQTVGDGTTTWSYDHANRLTGISYSDSTPAVTFGYDAAGNRTSMTDGAGNVTYTYDNLNRFTSVTRGSDTFSYSYDAAGNVSSRTFPGNLTTSYTYNGENLITAATTPSGTTSYTYDPAGDLTQTTLPSSNGYVETRTYDHAGRLVDVKNAQGSSVLSEFAATLDPVGNPTEIDRSGSINSVTTYTYDANDRLTGVCYQASCPNQADPYIAWTYDKVGNRLTETRPSGTTNYTYNADDQLIQAGATAYTYDANGNELTAGSSTYSYDLANRLTSADNGTSTTTYSYDGDGNRLQASSPTGTTNYLWDTNANAGVSQLAIERDGSGNPLRSYAYGVSRISMTTGGAAFYYHYDLLGSVANVTSATGATEWTYEYDPFGATRTATQNDPNAPVNPMQFAGEYIDSNGLYNLRAREYDTSTGRLLSIDPAVADAAAIGQSLFEYANDRPTMMIDPSGRTPTPSNAGTAAAGVASSGNGLPKGWHKCGWMICDGLSSTHGWQTIGGSIYLRGVPRNGVFFQYKVKVSSTGALAWDGAFSVGGGPRMSLVVQPTGNWLKSPVIFSSGAKVGYWVRIANGNPVGQTWSVVVEIYSPFPCSAPDELADTGGRPK